MADARTNHAQARGFDALKRHAVVHKIDVTLWFTRLLNIVFTFLYFVPIFGSQFPAHQKALLSSSITSALRLYQRQPRISLTREYLSQACSEDSFHYLAFSLLFALIKPISLALVPVFLFSLIHFASYSLTLLDILGQNSWWGARLFISLVELQSLNILRLIALCEIILMPYLVILSISGPVALTTLFMYYHFLILRCRSRRNPYTRNMFHDLRLKIEGLASRNTVPEFVRRAVFLSTRSISRLGLYNLEGQQ